MKRNSKERNFNDDEIITTGSNYSCKNLLSKGLALVLIILSFMFKGKQLYKSTLEWNEYFFIAE